MSIEQINAFEKGKSAGNANVEQVQKRLDERPGGELSDEELGGAAGGIHFGMRPGDVYYSCCGCGQTVGPGRPYNGPVPPICPNCHQPMPIGDPRMK